MERQQVDRLAQQFIDALHRLEQGGPEHAEGIAALFSDDARLTNAALILAGEQRQGCAGVRRFWTEYRATFGQARSDFHQVTRNERAAGLFWKTTGSDNAGQPLAYDGASLLVFADDGKIISFHGYYDTRQIGRTVGGGHEPI